MNADRLDAFTCDLAARGGRRTLLRWLTGAALGLGLWQRPELVQLGAAKKCKKIKDKQKRKKCLKNAKESDAGTSPPPPPPPPVPVRTYECPGPTEGSLGGAGLRFAQTFTAAQGGVLHRIQVAISKDFGSTGNYVVELLEVGADGVPTDIVLATAVIPNAAVPDGDTTLTAPFSGPPLVAGIAYAAALSRPGGSSVRLDARTGGDDCTGGTFRQSPGASFESLGATDLITAVTVLA